MSKQIKVGKLNLVDLAGSERVSLKLPNALQALFSAFSAWRLIIKDGNSY